MRRALIVKFGAIGDVIMAIPAAHELHRAGHQIDWVCGSAVAPILGLYPWIKPIVADDRALVQGSGAAKLQALAALWRNLAGRQYDLAATLYYDPRYRLMTLPVRADRRILLSHTDRRFRLLPGRHHTDEYARILLGLPDAVRPVALAPIPTPNLPPSPLAPVPGRSRVVLAPAGARNMLRDDQLRRWPPELYVELARRLLEQGTDIVLIGGPDDAWVRPYFADLPVTDRIGTLSLPETLALLDAADVLVTHDTGPLHLAGITRVGIVSIFGPTDPRGRLPQRPGTVALWGGEGFACRPCYDGRDFAACPSNDCMRQVTPALAAAEVARLLAERSHGKLGSPRVATPTSTVPGVPA
jgi:heptosyltransferase-2